MPEVAAKTRAAHMSNATECNFNAIVHLPHCRMSARILAPRPGESGLVSAWQTSKQAQIESE
jgi:hypothetical protein